MNALNCGRLARKSASRFLTGTACAILVGLLAAPVFAADIPIAIEMATEPQAPVNAQREWYRTLTDLGVTSLQIRQGRAGETPEIKNVGTQQSPSYRVLGVLTSRNELMLPGKRFTLRDTARLAEWLKDLRTGGIDRLAGEGQPFGLSPAQIDEVNIDLVRVNKVSTKGLTVRAALRAVSKQLKYPVLVDPRCLADLDTADPVTEELAGVTCGTVLAYLVQPAGLAMRPTMGADRKLQYLIHAPTPGGEVWPLGWPLEARTVDVLPAMLEQRAIELEDVAVNVLLEAIAKRVEIPILYDHPALARHGLDPTTAKISFPERRASYEVALRRTLHSVGMKHEIRTDEARRPFLWITSVKPVR